MNKRYLTDEEVAELRESAERPPTTESAYFYVKPSSIVALLDERADLRARLVKADVQAQWSKQPPTAEDVRVWQWWWNRAEGVEPHILQLDLDDLGLVVLCQSGIAFHPADWSGVDKSDGEWCRALPPPSALDAEQDERRRLVERVAETALAVQVKHPATHDLKCWPEPFQAVKRGEKTYEIRRCDDRIFNVGDALVLREWDPETAAYTGATLRVAVTYVTRPNEWGMPPDLCVLALVPESPPQCDVCTDLLVGWLHVRAGRTVPGITNDTIDHLARHGVKVKDIDPKFACPSAAGDDVQHAWNSVVSQLHDRVARAISDTTSKMIAHFERHGGKVDIDAQAEGAPTPMSSGKWAAVRSALVDKVAEASLAERKARHALADRRDCLSCFPFNRCTACSQAYAAYEDAESALEEATDALAAHDGAPA